MIYKSSYSKEMFFRLFDTAYMSMLFINADFLNYNMRFVLGDLPCW
jgi:hypothetical protein